MPCIKFINYDTNTLNELKDLTMNTLLARYSQQKLSKLGPCAVISSTASNILRRRRRTSEVGI